MCVCVRERGRECVSVYVCLVDTPSLLASATPLLCFVGCQGFLLLVETMLKVIGMNLRPFLPTMVAILLNMAQSSQSLLAQREEISGEYIKSLKSIRKLSIMRMAQFYRFFDPVRDGDSTQLQRCCVCVFLHAYAWCKSITLCVDGN